MIKQDKDAPECEVADSVKGICCANSIFDFDGFSQTVVETRISIESKKIFTLACAVLQVILKGGAHTIGYGKFKSCWEHTREQPGEVTLLEKELAAKEIAVRNATYNALQGFVGHQRKNLAEYSY